MGWKGWKRVGLAFGAAGDENFFHNLGDGFERGWKDFTGQTAIEKQNDFNLKMWQMENEYNTPANQVARLRAAGLNPNLFYSQGTTGNASAAPVMSAPPTNSSGLAKAFGWLQTLYSVKNMRAQNDNLTAQTANIDSQTQQHLADVDMKRATLEFYRKHGYFPGQTNAPTSIVKEVMNSPFVERSEQAFASALGEAYGRVTSSTDIDYSSPDHRARRLADDIVRRKKLEGEEREKYISRFLRAYRNAHSYNTR